MDITRKADTSTTVTQPKAVVSPLPDIIGLGGAVAGLAGGLAMAVVAALISFWLDGDIWIEAKQISAIFFGPEVAQRPGFELGPVVVGSLMHMTMSVLLGALFGIFTRRIFKLPSDFGVPVLAGLIYGLTLWLLAYFVVLPVINPWMLETYAPAFIVQNIVYGIVTGLVYTVLRPDPYGEHHDDPTFADGAMQRSYRSS